MSGNVLETYLSFVVRIRRAAEHDIERAQAWYEAKQPGLGSQFLGELARVISLLAETPLVYAAVYRGTHRAVLRHYPFLVWYRVLGDVVQVLAVTDGRQDPAKALARVQ